MSNLNDFIFYSKYARYIPSLGRKETREEASDRIFDMHLKHLSDNYPQVFESADFSNLFLETKEYTKSGKIFGSQRALQFGGNPILKHNEKLYNCCATYCDRIEVFKEIEYLLLCGCGVGVSLQKGHISKLPKMNKGKWDSEPYVIEDSIEGWANAVDRLFAHYFYNCSEPVFDYSQIRPKGSFINGGFKAPGPDGLRKSIEKIRSILDKVYNRDGVLKSIEILDIICHLADSVLSGGVRRSAVSIIFSPDDEDLMNAKTGNWFSDNPQRARSNNSALLDRDTSKKETFDKLFESTKLFGEPGFVFGSDPNIMFNPCFEIGMECIDIFTGKSGWSFCNLVSISGKDIDTEEDFYKACKYSSILGTIQASYTNFPFLTEATRNIVKTDALLGVSISGIMTNPDILLKPSVLEKGASIVKEYNTIISKLIGINEAVRLTCVKPDGNFSAMTGNSPGCHGAHSPRYLRRVQVNKEEEAGKIYSAVNPVSIEKSVYSNNDTDIVISFIEECKPGTIFKDDLLGIKQLEIVRLIQNYWVRPGCRNLESSKIEHNVSNTILVDDNWDEVRDYIWENRWDFAGISLLPKIGDLIYPQAPYTEIKSEMELIMEYGGGTIFASGLIVDAEDAFGSVWKACECFNGFGEKIFSTEDDAQSFIIENYLPNIDLDLPYREVLKIEENIVENKTKLLKTIGYSDEFIEDLIENEINIPIKEVMRYLDETNFSHVHKLQSKRDIIKRLKKFSRNYFDGNDSQMLLALKSVQILHDYYNIKRHQKEIDWKNIKWKEVEQIDIDTTGAASCAGGACEIVKL